MFGEYFGDSAIANSNSSPRSIPERWFQIEISINLHNFFDIREFAPVVFCYCFAFIFAFTGLHCRQLFGFLDYFYSAQCVSLTYFDFQGLGDRFSGQLSPESNLTMYLM